MSDAQVMAPIHTLDKNEQSVEWRRGFEVGANTIRMMVEAEEYQVLIHESNLNAMIKVATALGREFSFSWVNTRGELFLFCVSKPKRN